MMFPLRGENALLYFQKFHLSYITGFSSALWAKEGGKTALLAQQQCLLLLLFSSFFQGKEGRAHWKEKNQIL